MDGNFKEMSGQFKFCERDGQSHQEEVMKEERKMDGLDGLKEFGFTQHMDTRYFMSVNEK